LKSFWSFIRHRLTSHAGNLPGPPVLPDQNTTRRFGFSSLVLDSIAE
jgi:hypothetical protein